MTQEEFNFIKAKGKHMTYEEFESVMAMFDEQKKAEEARKDASYKANLRSLESAVEEVNEELCKDRMNHFAVWEIGGRKCRLVYKGKEDDDYFYGIGASFIDLDEGTPTQCLEKLGAMYCDGTLKELADSYRFYDDKKEKKPWGDCEWQEIGGIW
ncbi:MAG: hypothetical protein LUD47_03335 [Clostridia bacterium]|nr:hypothetical protein [Clostridia bacterium]